MYIIIIHFILVSGKVTRVNLSLHSDNYCGGNDVSIKIIPNYGSPCQTSRKSDFHKGTTVTWTGSELGSCLGQEFNVNEENLKFKVKSMDDNDFCPEFLTITVKNAYNQVFHYKSGRLNDWVDSTKGGHLRTAYRKILGKCDFCQKILGFGTV